MDGDAAGGGVGDERGLVRIAGQEGERVQAGGDALDVGVGQVGLERFDERVAAAAVRAAGASEVAVELAGLDEVGERELAWHVAAEVRVDLLCGDGVGERIGHQQPAEPQPGREDLAGRAGVEDALGGEALERADGVAVVAILGVVVVLDHEPVVAGGPLEQRRAPVGR